MKGTLSSSTAYNPLSSLSTITGQLKSDIWLLAFMITIGMLGCIYLIDACKSQYIQDQTLYLDQSSNSNNSPNAIKKLPYKGAAMMGSPLVFNMPIDQQFDQLIIDYGNGFQDIVTSDIALYEYNTPGTFHVKLIHVDQLKKTTIASTVIEIEDNNLRF